MTIDTTALVNAAKRVKQDNADLLAVLQSSRDTNAQLAVQLKSVQDQLAGLNPGADTSAQEAALAAIVEDLKNVADATEAAVAANKAVPDMPPASVSSNG